MAANLNGENEWVRYENATCLIKTPISQGTGFFFGGGWVMSVAHNFQNDDADPEQLHSLLPQTSFRFTLNDHAYDFQPQIRMAFIHHLQPGKKVDPHNMDIAMVKLGKQYEYGRTEFQPWELAEEAILQAMQLQSVFSTIHDQQAAPNDTVHAIYYAGEEPNVPRRRTELNVAGERNHRGNPIMKLQPPLQPGASGCPIINGNFELVGLLVGSGDAASVALMWNRGIQRYTREGVRIIANIDGYMAYGNQAINQPQADLRRAHEVKAENERKQLEETAKNARLTIYLMNGDVIKGPEANICSNCWAFCCPCLK